MNSYPEHENAAVRITRPTEKPCFRIRVLMLGCALLRHPCWQAVLPDFTATYCICGHRSNIEHTIPAEYGQ